MIRRAYTAGLQDGLRRRSLFASSHAEEETAMDRDAYIEKMKAKIDEWNAEISKQEAKARAAQADMKLKYEDQCVS